MFFEFEKGQGGGPVKDVTIDEENNYAIIEFEKEKGNILQNLCTEYGIIYVLFVCVEVLRPSQPNVVMSS